MNASFLKWLGGKARTAQQIAALAPADYGRYIEPFMGSAAVFFALEPESAVLADANPELVVCFQQVKEDPETVMAELDRMPNTREDFHRVRALDPGDLSDLQRAARVIYLNKTAFRGLWRVNKRGQYNVPYGDYDRPLYNPTTMLGCSRVLQSAEVREGHFLETLREAKPDDWVYLDPPYVPAGGYSDFKRYTADQFHDKDQRQLVKACRLLDDAGVRFVLTNTDNEYTRSLYDRFRLSVLATRRDVNLNSRARASTDLLVSNYELPEQVALFAAA